MFSFGVKGEADDVALVVVLQTSCFLSISVTDAFVVVVHAGQCSAPSRSWLVEEARLFLELTTHMELLRCTVMMTQVEKDGFSQK